MERKMSRILEKEEINSFLKNYYIEKFGERDTDIWFEQPAVNVWLFKRDNKYIALKCHILNGEVTEHVEEA